MIMNKILIDSNDILIKETGIYYLKITNGDYNIKVLENVESKLVIISENNQYNLNFVLKNNSNLIVNSLNLNSNNNIAINLLENSKIIYNQSVVGKKDSINNMDINHLGNNTSSIINNNGINLYDNKLFFVINGKVNKQLLKVNCTQNSKIINYQKGNSKIIPNLIIDSNDINASHSAYIGNFDSNQKFYMASRGISEKMILQVLYKAVLLGKMEFTNLEDEFNRIVNEWW